MKIRRSKKKINRILILGGIGSGKTTLAREISQITKLPHLGIDWIVYKKPWTERNTKKVIIQEMKKASRKRRWVMEGVYSQDWLIPAIKKADLVIILHLPKNILVKRIIFRYLKNKSNKKNKNIESFKDMLNLIKFSYKYKKETFPRHKKMVHSYSRNYLILNNPKEVNKYLEELRLK